MASSLVTAQENIRAEWVEAFDCYVGELPSDFVRGLGPYRKYYQVSVDTY